MIKSKKAAITDAIFVPMYILVVGITLIICYFVWTSIGATMNDIAGNSTILSASHIATIQSTIQSITVNIGYFDSMIPFMVGGLLIVSLVFAFKTGSSVIYGFLSIIFWAFAMIMSSVFTNIFGEFETTFASTATSFPILVYIMNNMKWLVLIWLFLVSIVMFTRNKAEERALASSEVVYG